MGLKAPGAHDPRSIEFIFPQPLALQGAIRSAVILQRTNAANPPVSIFGTQLNKPCSPFPYYIDKLAIRGIRTKLPPRRLLPFQSFKK